MNKISGNLDTWEYNIIPFIGLKIYQINPNFYLIMMKIILSKLLEMADFNYIKYIKLSSVFLFFFLCNSFDINGHDEYV